MISTLKGFKSNMKLPYYTKKDKWLILILVPPVDILINYLIFGPVYFSRIPLFIVATIITGVISFLCWHLLLAVAILMQNKYPLHSQTFKRLVLSLLLYMILTMIIISVTFFMYDLIDFFEYEINLTRYKWAILSGIFINLMTSTLIEGFAFYERWKKASDEAEELKIENLHSQLESLKAQVNPHFLFNSLNTLCSLISEEPAKAETFLLKLSKVYRYLLVSSEEHLASLSAELQFIQAYFHLLKTRYGNTIFLTIDVDDRLLNLKLPSLTLQILVENAVKHNIMDKNSPLRIQISAVGNNRLLIKNNLQLKLSGVTSNKVGLSNIEKKYKLLKHEGLLVNSENGEFCVVVPLISSVAKEEGRLTV